MMADPVHEITNTPHRDFNFVDPIRTLKRGMVGANLTGSIAYRSYSYAPGALRAEMVTDEFGKYAENIVIAGGSVLAYAERASGVRYSNEGLTIPTSNWFQSSDIDIYLRVTDHREALQVTEFFLRRFPPVGSVRRSAYALSYECEISAWLNCPVFQTAEKCICNDKKCVKLQIIDRMLPKTVIIENDIQELFSTYDLDCCKWALYANKFYTTPSAVRAFTKRICHIKWAKVTDSLIPRMARYFTRCYDFEIDGYDSRSVEFPDAIAKILTIAGSQHPDMDSFDFNEELPSSNYELRTIYDKHMFHMFKNFGWRHQMPYMLCAEERSDVWQIIMDGTQPKSYLEDWSLEMYNHMAENILWMANTCENDRSVMRDICIKSVAEWCNVCMAFKLPPMFNSAEFIGIGLTAEVFQRFWQPKGASKTVINVIW